jgi:hypothetical protein
VTIGLPLLTRYTPKKVVKVSKLHGIRWSNSPPFMYQPYRPKNQFTSATKSSQIKYHTQPNLLLPVSPPANGTLKNHSHPKFAIPGNTSTQPACLLLPIGATSPAVIWKNYHFLLSPPPSRIHLYKHIQKHFHSIQSTCIY